MNEYEQKLKKYMQEDKVKGQHLTFTQSCHSVAEAATAVGASPDDFVKNICLLDEQGNLIIAIVKGEDKADRTTIAKVLNVPKIKMASPTEILEKTGYPCGGTPSFGYEAVFLIDTKVMEKEIVYSGGGSENSLVKISSLELQKANQGTIVRIRK
ncbi:MAG TPA: YbaK/EbsC family protein [Candidatus Nanoarchaeia archaeon]|nr:YbaK/EbsC family protein [Candidatus Nanoarchaeia archaeon]